MPGQSAKKPLQAGKPPIWAPRHPGGSRSWQLLTTRCGLLGLLLGLGEPGMAADQLIFKYLDREGRVLYTDDPQTAAGAQLLESWTWKGWEDHSYNEENSRNRSLYAPLIEAAARRHDLNPQLVHAVVRVESSYRPNAVSRAGAVGLMQLMPETARRFGVRDRRDPDANLEGGSRYLKHLLKLFDGDLELALAAYNAGEGAVLRAGRKIPPYQETIRYVKKVLVLLRAEPEATAPPKKTGRPPGQAPKLKIKARESAGPDGN